MRWRLSPEMLSSSTRILSIWCFYLKGKMHMPNADKVLEAEYTEAEMAAVVRLGAKWIEWQQLFPYATGSGINRLAKIVIAVDKHVDGIEDLTVARSAALR